MKFVLIGLLAFGVIAFLLALSDSKRKFNIMKTIFCFLCAIAFLVVAIITGAYLMLIGTAFFIILGIICAKNIDDNL